jgi:hypothetical protein
MTFTDDIDPQGNIPPGLFRYGRTDLRVNATVRVERGSSAVHFDVSVENTLDREVEYEYWTCTTLTPGSVPGATGSPANTTIVAPTRDVLAPAVWGWIASVESPSITGEPNVYTYDKLKEFSEWRDWGILYAWPKFEQNFWGAINNENGVGIIRVADPVATPGLKFWTWGVDSVNTDLEEPDEERPYIELWAGHSPEFFTPAYMQPRETKAWGETYLSIVGLDQVDFSSELGSGSLTVSCDRSHAGLVSVSAKAFVSKPGDDYVVSLVAVMSGGAIFPQTLYHEIWSPSADRAGAFTSHFMPPSQTLASGASIEFVLEDLNGDAVLRGSAPMCGGDPLPPPPPAT